MSSAKVRLESGENIGGMTCYLVLTVFASVVTVLLRCSRCMLITHIISSMTPW